MNKNKKVITLFLGLFFVLIVTNILGILIGESFYFCLKPFLFMTLAVLIYLFTEKKIQIKRMKKYVNQVTIMASILYLILYILSGIIFGFAYNPLVMQGSHIFFNILYYLPNIIAIEFIRYRLINYLDKEKRFSYTIILSIILSLAMSNIAISAFKTFSSFLEMFYIQIVPNFVIGLYLSYTYIKGNLLPGIIYMLLPAIYQLVSKVLPNPQWIIPVLLKTGVPLTAYFLTESMDLLAKKEVKKIKVTRPIFDYLGLGVMTFFILFACGIFRIYPVAIASNSMNPTFARGDLEIIDKKKQIYQVGDIIQFYGLNNTIFVHRVVNVREENNIHYYTTKGDNNNDVDLLEISENMVIGKSLFTIKYLGYPTVWLSEKF